MANTARTGHFVALLKFDPSSLRHPVGAEKEMAGVGILVGGDSSTRSLQHLGDRLGILDAVAVCISRIANMAMLKQRPTTQNGAPI